MAFYGILCFATSSVSAACLSLDRAFTSGKCARVNVVMTNLLCSVYFGVMGFGLYFVEYDMTWVITSIALFVCWVLAACYGNELLATVQYLTKVRVLDRGLRLSQGKIVGIQRQQPVNAEPAPLLGQVFENVYNENEQLLSPQLVMKNNGPRDEEIETELCSQSFSENEHELMNYETVVASQVQEYNHYRDHRYPPHSPMEEATCTDSSDQTELHRNFVIGGVVRNQNGDYDNNTTMSRGATGKQVGRSNEDQYRDHTCNNIYIDETSSCESEEAIPDDKATELQSTSSEDDDSHQFLDSKTINDTVSHRSSTNMEQPSGRTGNIHTILEIDDSDTESYSAAPAEASIASSISSDSSSDYEHVGTTDDADNNPTMLQFGDERGVMMGSEDIITASINKPQAPSAITQSHKQKDKKKKHSRSAAAAQQVNNNDMKEEVDDEEVLQHLHRQKQRDKRKTKSRSAASAAAQQANIDEMNKVSDDEEVIHQRQQKDKRKKKSRSAAAAAAQQANIDEMNKVADDEEVLQKQKRKDKKKKHSRSSAAAAQQVNINEMNERADDEEIPQQFHQQKRKDKKKRKQHSRAAQQVNINEMNKEADDEDILQHLHQQKQKMYVFDETNTNEGKQFQQQQKKKSKKRPPTERKSVNARGESDDDVEDISNRRLQAMLSSWSTSFHSNQNSHMS